MAQIDDSALPALTEEQRELYETLSAKQRAAFLRRAAQLGNAPERPGPARPYTRRAVTAFGETKTLTEWAADPRCLVERNILYSRIFVSEWPAEQAIVTPLQPHLFARDRDIKAITNLPKDRGGAP